MNFTSVRWKWIAFFAATAIIIGAIFMTQAILDLRDQIRGNRQGVQCVLRELLEHRRNNWRADQIQTEALGERFTLPEPPEVPDEWNTVCSRFVRQEEALNG